MPGNTVGYHLATSIKLDAALQDRVRRLAELHRRTSRSIMLEANSQYVEREEKCETLKQEAMQVWRDCQTAGTHVTHEEMDAYLAKLEAGDDLGPPACHY